ncbi:gp015 [Rhodococcus phage ReqiDocB7]|uniref:head-tail adaptor n=1 Tax=Rhodococcus phage ReqiDocB7 TaxID=691966 RepID=UPI0001CDD751|nr:head-tail adaptor [Rhodococcus phage ReqiDocB7]ADD80801.1 gp015 [Rhodococcus phage ReqiDocB7]
MALRDGYCEPADLLLSGQKMIAGTPEQYIAMASDEIDAFIGHLYRTPIMVNVLDAEKRQDSLVLKGVCSQLATGRYLTGASSGGEQSRTHAYGEYLLRFAYNRLKQIASGAIELTSAEKIPQMEEDKTLRGPIIMQKHEVSLVDGYYDTFNPEGFISPRQPSDLDWMGF